MDEMATLGLLTESRPTAVSVIDSCQKLLEVIWQVVPPGSPIVYIDYPMHLNFGDLLINRGVERFFSHSAYRVKGRLSFFDMCDWPNVNLPHIILREQIVRRLLRFPKNTIFVFHGGGNLGDIYVELNSMRQALIERLHEYRVVVLPQSIHFSCAATQRQCLSSLLQHPDFHIFVRDQASLEAIRSVSPTAGIACPDMAHMLWAEFAAYRAVPPSRERLYMRRRDVESTAEGGAPSADTLDWIDLVTRTDAVAFRAIRKFHSAAPVGFSIAHSHRDWYVFRDHLLARAIRHFVKYHEIDTDRLHGLILAGLLGRKAIFSDNSYGKLSRYYDRWLRQAPLDAIQGRLAGT